MRGFCRRVSFCLVAAAMFAVLWQRSLVAQGRSGSSDDSSGNAKSAASKESELFKRWVEFYGKEAAGYEVYLTGKPPAKLKLETEPVLTYTNPVRTGQQHGAIYVWTLDGRPQAIASIWSSMPQDLPNQRSITHEFQSLSERGLFSKHAQQIGRRGVVPDWNCSEGGIQYKNISGVAAPGKSAGARLLQMRSLSRKFTAEILNNKDEDGQSLRLLTQPVYRYASEPAHVVDGALFTFVMGTDPEVILTIEAVETDGGPKWQYAVARFTNRPLQVDYAGDKVWGCSGADAYVGNHPYFLYWGVSVRDAIPE